MLEFSRVAMSDDADTYSARAGDLTITAEHQLGGDDFVGHIDLYVGRDGDQPEFVGVAQEGIEGIPADQYLDKDLRHYENVRHLNVDVDAFFSQHPPQSALDDVVEMRRLGYRVSRHVDSEFGGVRTAFLQIPDGADLPTPRLSPQPVGHHSGPEGPGIA